MTTLITTKEVKGPQAMGKVVYVPKRKGHCNEQCYNAKSEVCLCCCGGVNHGVGLQKAIENTKQMSNRTDVTFNEKVLTQDCRIRDAKGRFIKKGSD